MEIRRALESDRSEIERVYLAAFKAEERTLVAQVAVGLLCLDDSLGGFSLVACDGGNVLGHVAFSPLAFDPCQTLEGSILSPLAVDPKAQGRGIGSRLVNEGLKALRAEGKDIVLVYGDPNYYGRFNFREDVARNYRPPYKLQFPSGWLGLKLRPFESGSEWVPFACAPPLSRPDLW